MSDPHGESSGDQYISPRNPENERGQARDGGNPNNPQPVNESDDS